MKDTVDHAVPVPFTSGVKESCTEVAFHATVDFGHRQNAGMG